MDKIEKEFVAKINHIYHISTSMLLQDNRLLKHLLNQSKNIMMIYLNHSKLLMRLVVL